MSAATAGNRLADDIGPLPQPVFRIRKVPLPAWACIFDSSACRRDVSQLHDELESRGWSLRLITGVTTVPRRSGAYSPRDREKWVEVLEEALGPAGALAVRTGSAGSADEKLSSSQESLARRNQSVQDKRSHKNLPETAPDEDTTTAGEAVLKEPGLSSEGPDVNPAVSLVKPEGFTSGETGASIADSVVEGANATPNVQKNGADRSNASYNVFDERNSTAVDLLTAQNRSDSWMSAEKTMNFRADAAGLSNHGPEFGTEHDEALFWPLNGGRTTFAVKKPVHQSIDEATKRELLARYAPVSVDMKDLTWGALARWPKRRGKTSPGL